MLKTNTLFSFFPQRSQRILPSPTISYTNQSHLFYISKRKEAITNIKFLISFFCLPSTIYYKSITYMDNIMLKSPIVNWSLDNISTICVLFAIQFNERVSHHIIQEMFNLINLIPNFHQLEIECLISLDYDLSTPSIYDYINESFFYSNSFDINNTTYQKVINFVDNVLEDDHALDFTRIELALTAIKIVFEQNCYSNKDILRYFYNVQESLSMKCYCVLNALFNSFYVKKQNSLYKWYKKYSFLSSSSTVDSLSSM